MKTRQKIVAAIETLASGQDVSNLSLAEISRASGVSWPTVRRHVGGREGLASFIKQEEIEIVSDPDAAQTSLPDVRMKILEAAFRIFADKGYPGASMDAVAEEAGMTKGAVYWHFASKKDLFRELMLLRNAEGIAVGPARLEEAEVQSGGIDASDNPHDIFTKFLERQIHLVGEERDWWWLTFENLTEARDPDMRRDLASGLTSLINANETLIDDQKIQGRLSQEVNSEGMAVLFQALLIGLGYLNLMDDKLVQGRDLGAKIAHTLWHGLDHSAEHEGVS